MRDAGNEVVWITFPAQLRDVYFKKMLVPLGENDVEIQAVTLLTVGVHFRPFRRMKSLGTSFSSTR